MSARPLCTVASKYMHQHMQGIFLPNAFCPIEGRMHAYGDQSMPVLTCVPPCAYYELGGAFGNVDSTPMCTQLAAMHTVPCDLRNLGIT